MLNIFRSLLVLHIVFGFLGLVAFWFPIFSKKGRTLHKRAGRAFLWSGYIVAGSAIALALVTVISPFGTHPEDLPSDPARLADATTGLRTFSVFLAYLGVITLASVHHGVRAMQTKKNLPALRTPFHTAVNRIAVASSVLVLIFGLMTQEIPLIALSPLGLLIGVPNLRYARRPKASKMAHWYEHIGAMLGGGIAFHTAFAVFGVQRFIDYTSEGFVGVLPWILPGVVGTIGTSIWVKHYRRKFGELDPKAATVPAA